MRSLFPFEVVIAATLGTGCAQIIGIDKDYTQGGGGSTVAGPGAGGSSAPSSTTVGAGATGAATSSSGTGTAGSGGSGGTLSCPQTPAPMVNVGSFCIDAYEVTDAEYATWLKTNPSTANQDPWCAFNTAFWDTAAHGTAPSSDSFPVVYVDWCDAQAFCKAHGKRLCGRIGGGSADYTTGWTDPTQSQWFYACTDGSANHVYPYGDTYDPQACNGLDNTSTGFVAVGMLSGCHGSMAPFDKIFDMSGNAYEWEDSCDFTNGAGDYCHRRGGSCQSNSSQVECKGNDTNNHTRNELGSTTGFRCCYDGT